MADKTAFEVPDEMRTMALSGVEQARRAFEQVMEASKEAMGRLERQAGDMQAGALGLNRQLLGLAERNVEAGFELATQIARARDPQEIVRLQTEFVRSQLSVIGEQVRTFADVAASAVRPPRS